MVQPASPKAPARKPRAPATPPPARVGPPLDYGQQLAIFSILSAANPRPTTELQYRDAFTLLVAVALSAQATDVGVNKATPALFDAAPTPQAMLALGVEGVTEHIKTIGLFRQKARNLIAMSQRLVEVYGGQVPSSRVALMTLPGVGRKTANVVLNTVWRVPAQAVDTHIFRVGNRTGLARGKTPLEVEAKLDKAVPQPFRLHAHHWLILHGRYTCKARTPECWRCVVADLCAYKPKTPPPPARKAPAGDR